MKITQDIYKNKLGFTLIELSIVLVIIGLIVGGVLVGRDLIKSSEIRAQISQIEEVKTAINTFKAKYGYMPGDMPPTQTSQLGFFTFTGAQAGNGCKVEGFAFGNSDGIINGAAERFPFWSHLSDSKLIKGSYGGVSGNLLRTSAPTCTIGPGIPIAGYPSDYEENALFFPSSKLSSNIGSLEIMGNMYTAPKTTPILVDSTTRNHVITIYDIINVDYVFSAHQLYQIDTKIDDGFPGSGDVREISPAVDDPPCTTTGVSPIKYDLSPATAEQLKCWGVMVLF